MLLLLLYLKGSYRVAGHIKAPLLMQGPVLLLLYLKGPTVPRPKPAAPAVLCCCLFPVVVQYMRRWKVTVAVSPAEREPVPALKDSTGWHIFCLGYADQEEEDDEDVVESGAAAFAGFVSLSVPLTTFSRNFGAYFFLPRMTVNIGLHRNRRRHGTRCNILFLKALSVHL